MRDSEDYKESIICKVSMKMVLSVKGIFFIQHNILKCSRYAFEIWPVPLSLIITVLLTGKAILFRRTFLLCVLHLLLSAYSSRFPPHPQFRDHKKTTSCYVWWCCQGYGSFQKSTIPSSLECSDPLGYSGESPGTLGFSFWPPLPSPATCGKSLSFSGSQVPF